MTTDTSLRLQRVVILGANGAMGAGAAALFAGGGCAVTLVARDIPRCEGALAAIQGIAKSERIADDIGMRTYAEGMQSILAGADLVFEAVAEDLALKREILAQVDAARPPEALVATVSSGLSIRAMAQGMSAGFRSHFAGVHLYNPPHMMSGTELIPHPDMPAAVGEQLSQILSQRFGRQMVLCQDMPAFAGNRIGFKVLNEVAQLAEQHGVQLMDTLVGPYTGRALAPLATVDLVGLDVHKAIVDNVAANLRDEASAAFVLPAYMDKLILHGHLGDKTPQLGGFYRRVTEDGSSHVQVLDPKSGGYVAQQKGLSVPFVDGVRDLNRRGRYREAMARFMSAEHPLADVARRVVLGYISYALSRIGPGEVVQSADDVDRIMSAGFNWVPPTALVDIIGVERTLQLLDRYDLPQPALLRAARAGEAPATLFRLANISAGRYLSG